MLTEPHEQSVILNPSFNRKFDLSGQFELIHPEQIAANNQLSPKPGFKLDDCFMELESGDDKQAI